MSQLHAATIKDVLFFFCENLCAQQTGFARCGCRQDTHARTHTKLYCFSLENVFSPRRILKLYQYLLLLFFQVTNPLQFYILWGEEFCGSFTKENRLISIHDEDGPTGQESVSSFAMDQFDKTCQTIPCTVRSFANWLVQPSFTVYNLQKAWNASLSWLCHMQKCAALALCVMICTNFTARTICLNASGILFLMHRSLS